MFCHNPVNNYINMSNLIVISKVAKTRSQLMPNDNDRIFHIDSTTRYLLID